LHTCAIRPTASQQWLSTLVATFLTEIMAQTLRWIPTVTVIKSTWEFGLSLGLVGFAVTTSLRHTVIASIPSSRDL
jgi:hypothetical protein